ncbi:unnamed protein product [Effrenium voratum]|nr:unnamed protein product [Effrenium voratum]
MPDQDALKAGETSIFLFQAEGFDARRSNQSKRCYVDVFLLDDDKVCSETPVMSTRELGIWWGRETPAHRIHVGEGSPQPSVPAGCKLLLVVVPQPGTEEREPLRDGEKFFLRMASRPHHQRSTEFTRFSDFLPARVKHHTLVAAKYNETDVTNQIINIYDAELNDVKSSGGTCGQEGDDFVFTNFNALFGDPAPGVPKQLAVTCQVDGEEQTVTAPESEWMRLPRPRHENTECPDYDEFGDWTWGIRHATFGPLDVTAVLRGVLCELGGKLEILKKFGEKGETNLGETDLFGDPQPGVPKKLTVKYVDGEQTWDESQEVRLDRSHWKPSEPWSPARAGAGRGVALAKETRPS